jgi:hypothetical protein
VLWNPFDAEGGLFRNYVSDMSTKSALALAQEASVRGMIERGELPPDYQIPEHVKAFEEALRGPARRDVINSCAFIRAVALQPQ